MSGGRSTPTIRINLRSSIGEAIGLAIGLCLTALATPLVAYTIEQNIQSAQLLWQKAFLLAIGLGATAIFARGYFEILLRLLGRQLPRRETAHL